MTAVKAVIFDIDGTLTPLVSWTELTRCLGGSVPEHERIFIDFKRGITSYEVAKRQLLELWRATGRADRESMRMVFEDWPLHPAAAPLIQELQAWGIAVGLISGSVDLYVATVARRLGAIHAYANTTLEFDAGGRLKDFHYTLEQGVRKLEQFDEFLRQQGLEANSCIAVGDGPNDLELFRATGRGILVATGGGAEGEIRAAAWKVAATLGEVGSIIRTAGSGQ